MKVVVGPSRDTVASVNPKETVVGAARTRGRQTVARARPLNRVVYSGRRARLLGILRGCVSRHDTGPGSDLGRAGDSDKPGS